MTNAKVTNTATLSPHTIAELINDSDVRALMTRLDTLLEPYGGELRIEEPDPKLEENPNMFGVWLEECDDGSDPELVGTGLTLFEAFDRAVAQLISWRARDGIDPPASAYPTPCLNGLNLFDDEPTV
jgi:hypothetical protein